MLALPLVGSASLTDPGADDPEQVVDPLDAARLRSALQLDRRPLPSFLAGQVLTIEAKFPNYEFMRAVAVQGEWPLDFLQGIRDFVYDTRTFEDEYEAAPPDPRSAVPGKMAEHIFGGTSVFYSWSLYPSILTRNILILLVGSAMLTVVTRSTGSAILRRRRASKNQCVRCAYPRPDRCSPCPECGASVPAA